MTNKRRSNLIMKNLKFRLDEKNKVDLNLKKTEEGDYGFRGINNSPDIYKRNSVNTLMGTSSFHMDKFLPLTKKSAQNNINQMNHLSSLVYNRTDNDMVQVIDERESYI